jgi:hypothetical protein
MAKSHGFIAGPRYVSKWRSAQIAFLRSIFGIGAVAEQVSRQRIDVIEIGQRRVVKTPRVVMMISASVARHDVMLGFPGSS